MVSMTGISVFANFFFLMVLQYWVAPNVPFLIHRHSSTEVRIPTDKSLAIIFSTLLIQEHGSQLQQYFL